MVAPAVLKLPGRAGDTLRVPPAAITTVLQDTRYGHGLAAARRCFRSQRGPKVNGVPSLRAKCPSLDEQKVLRTHEQMSPEQL